MKKFAIVFGLAALAACSRSETPAEREAAEAAAVEAARIPLGPYHLQAGSYQYTRSDGIGGLSVLVADGTYSNTITDGGVETGKWVDEGDKSCLIPDDGSGKRCYRFSQPDAQGSFTGVMDDGLTVEVRKTA